MVNICEGCKKEFEAKTKRAATCSNKCKKAKYNAENPEKVKAQRDKYAAQNPEKNKTFLADWRVAHPDYQRQWRDKNKERLSDYYDNGIIRYEQWRRDNPDYSSRRYASLREDPEKYAQHLARVREYKRQQRAQNTHLAARAAYLADPINAARVEAANLTRMSQEERDAWVDAAEKQREKEERKEIRAATRKIHAAKQTTPAKIEEAFPAVFDLEWSE